MSQILLVEDSKVIANVVRKRIAAAVGCDVVAATTFAEARKILNGGGDFCLGLLDMTLPDAPDGEVIEYVTKRGIPTVVFTGFYSEDIRKRVLAMNVIDYVVKDSPASLQYLVSLARRIYRNRTTKVLVVDDSSASRKYLTTLLGRYQLQVLEACDGVEAMDMVEADEDIRLVVTDYNMPNMDGFELIKALRRSYDNERMAIIGISAAGSNELSARFIKIGANDFITKPFLEEEFFCRISQNITNLEQLQELRDAATKDFLTKLYNRRFFFDTAVPMFATAQKRGTLLATAMIDVDFFKKVNDTYGHDAGDDVLKAVAGVLRETVRKTDLLARFGGEEFCIVAEGLVPDEARAYFDNVRQAIEATVIESGEHTIRITASIGVCPVLKDSLDDMLTAADAMLYEAKEGGRNQVVLSD